jgi:hypothetical protein
MLIPGIGHSLKLKNLEYRKKRSCFSYLDPSLGRLEILPRRAASRLSDALNDLQEQNSFPIYRGWGTVEFDRSIDRNNVVFKKQLFRHATMSRWGNRLEDFNEPCL